jgi:hypothetical protein
MHRSFSGIVLMKNEVQGHIGEELSHRYLSLNIERCIEMSSKSMAFLA